MTQEYFVTVEIEQGDLVTVDSCKDTQVTAVGIQGPPGVAGSLSAVSDVDATNVTNGSVLVYKTTTSKWTATTTLDAQNMEGGEF